MYKTLKDSRHVKCVIMLLAASPVCHSSLASTSHINTPPSPPLNLFHDNRRSCTLLAIQADAFVLSRISKRPATVNDLDIPRLESFRSFTVHGQPLHAPIVCLQLEAAVNFRVSKKWLQALGSRSRSIKFLISRLLTASTAS
jgi:hypothetical protein